MAKTFDTCPECEPILAKLTGVERQFAETDPADTARAALARRIAQMKEWLDEHRHFRKHAAREG